MALRRTTSSDKPRGELAVRRALLSAAADVYGRGPFSVRKVAERAGVNHGQVHHYFGGLSGLKRALLERLGGELDEQIDRDAPEDIEALLQSAARATQANKRFVYALARRVLEEPEDGDYQLRFPVVTRLQSALREAVGEGGDILLAEGLARSLGWSLFGRWITQAVGLSDEAVRQIEDRMTSVTPLGGAGP